MMKYLLISLFFFIVWPFRGQEFTLTHDGLTRTYRLHLPDDYHPDSLYALVINMHGLGSNAFEQEFYSEFNAVADSFGFIVTYPNGVNETWNISSPSGTDDVGFISALIDTINLAYPLDLNRVFATGMSMGGFMSYRLACELSDRIAAIASVTGLQAFYPCSPSRPVPVMQFHGTADPVVPYAGVPTTIANWVNYNGCPSSPEVTELPDIDTTDNSTVTKSYYGPCDELSEVILYTINGGEHTWPGASFIIGITNQDIEASFEIWNFFNQYTLAGPTSTEEIQFTPGEHVRFYPNPVRGMATVELSFFLHENLEFRMYNLAGETVRRIDQIHDARFVVDCSALSPGLYFAEILTSDRKFYQKVVVQ